MKQTEVGFASCSVPGCRLLSSDPPFKHEGNVLCVEHAIMRARGLCAECGCVFTRGSLFGNLNVYADRAGRALCIDCWACS